MPQALLLAVRTCYNIHLMSRSEVNQTTAKATLTQVCAAAARRVGRVPALLRPCMRTRVAGMTTPLSLPAPLPGAQMLNVVFQRMEAGSMLVQVRPIAVADMLGRSLGAGGTPDAAGAAPAVQAFLNGVISMTG